MMDDNEIRDRFEELCRRLGWHGPTKIAKELTADQGDVSRWLNGTRSIPPHHLESIARRAGEDASYFAPDPWPGRRPRRDRLIAAYWFEQQAEELRAEALEADAPPTPTPEANGDAPDSQVSADNALPEDNGGKQVPGNS